jgi:hypothetical protein
MPDNDLFSSLLCVQWKGIGFPVSSFRHGLSHDLVEHRFMDRDGAHIEATGRAPMVYSARAMFRNGIAPGPSEAGRWTFPLYPYGWRDFLEAAADRSTGDLVHPELGTIRCKLRSAETDWSASARDGVDVEISWVESVDDADATLDALLLAASPLAAAKIAAQDLSTFAFSDKTKALAAALTGPKDPSGYSLGDLLNDVQAAIDQGTLLERRIVGKVDQAINRADRLVEALNRLSAPQDWPGKRSAEVLADSLATLRRQALAPLGGAKATRYYVTTGPTTLARIAAAIGRAVSDIVAMNPDLARSPVVPAATLVRYAAA